jgi:chemotaxis protein CheX
MNVKYMNPFVEAATEGLQAECQVTVTRGSLSLHKSAITANDVTVLISLIGQIQGVVLYGLSTSTGMALVSRVLGQEFSEFDSLAQSGVAELGNVITGRATVKLSQTGISANISPPTLILGKGLTISTLDFARVLVPLATDSGEVIVHLALRDSPPDMRDSNFVPVTLPKSMQAQG